MPNRIKLKTLGSGFLQRLCHGKGKKWVRVVRVNTDVATVTFGIRHWTYSDVINRRARDNKKLMWNEREQWGKKKLEWENKQWGELCAYNYYDDDLTIFVYVHRENVWSPVAHLSVILYLGYCFAAHTQTRKKVHKNTSARLYAS